MAIRADAVKVDLQRPVPSAVSRNRWVDIRGQRDSSQAGKPAAGPAGLKPREPQKQGNIFEIISGADARTQAG